MALRKLIFINGNWHIVQLAPARSFRMPRDVWMNPETTTMICLVGEEVATANLPLVPKQQEKSE